MQYDDVVQKAWNGVMRGSTALLKAALEFEALSCKRVFEFGFRTRIATYQRDFSP